MNLIAVCITGTTYEIPLLWNYMYKSFKSFHKCQLIKQSIKVLASCLWSVSECYQSLTAHQQGHTVPKQVIMIATSIQVATV